MNMLVSVAPHTRKPPFAKERAETTAKLMAEVEAKVDRQISASFRTFSINIWRAVKEGKL